MKAALRSVPANSSNYRYEVKIALNDKVQWKNPKLYNGKPGVKQQS